MWPILPPFERFHCLQRTGLLYFICILTALNLLINESKLRKSSPTLNDTLMFKLEGTVLENVESIKYLGVTITKDLKWNTHISNACTKANRTLGCLRQNLFSCPQDVREAAYKGLVRPILEYGSSVWDPHYEGLIYDLEKVQKRAAMFVTRKR